jgi:hypothetical protein
MNEQIKIPKLYIDLIDQIFEIERKAESIREVNSINRNINRMKELFENIFSTTSELDTGLSYYNPIGESYNDTRTDLEASIAGNSTDDLFITEVIKPIIRYRKGNMTIIARKGVVVAESKTKTV